LNGHYVVRSIYVHFKIAQLNVQVPHHEAFSKKKNHITRS